MVFPTGIMPIWEIKKKNITRTGEHTPKSGISQMRKAKTNFY